MVLFYLCRLFEGGDVDDALDKLSHALEVEPEFHDGRSYMLHIKSQQQAKEVRTGRMRQNFCFMVTSFSGQCNSFYRP